MTPDQVKICLEKIHKAVVDTEKVIVENAVNNEAKGFAFAKLQECFWWAERSFYMPEIKKKEEKKDD